MSDNWMDPSNEDSPFFAGQHSDRTVTVAVQLRFRIPDEVALRAKYLVESGGDVSPDWGVESAVMQEATSVLARAGWSGVDVVPVSAHFRAGRAATLLEEQHFSA